MKGKRIKNLERIIVLANMRRAVWFGGWTGPKAAAFVIGMPLRSVDVFLKRGLYEYAAKIKQ
jgi:hypothetical protein